jgi:hypothetical protein
VLQDLIVVEEEDDRLLRRKPRPGLRERIRAKVQSLDLGARFPALKRWLAGRRVDIEARALGVSLGVHLVLLLVLGTVGYAVHHEAARQFQAETVDTTLPDLERTAYQDLDEEKLSTVGKAGSFAPELSTVTVSTGVPNPVGRARDVSAVGAGPLDLAKLDVKRATEAVVPTASILGQTVSIRGDGAEHTGSAEGAVDRIAQEIVRRLEKGRTLVVWAFDASGSLQAERERLAGHIERVYGHITQLDKESRAADGGLLTAVVAFGQDRKAMTEHPTDDAGAIVSAIRAVSLDASGIETTFQTVAEVVHRYGHYRDPKNNAYKTMAIVVTDEVGDDESHLEEAIEAATKAKVPVFVLGSSAVFGRVNGRMNYTDPKTGHTYYNLPVRQGPESVMLEQVRLPFWYGGDQYDLLDSGFGPYALSRLAGATGGIYFVTRLGPRRLGVDPAALREYKPDWVSRARYEADVANHPVRRAVIEASVLTQENNLPGMPSLFFPPVDGPEFKEAMERNQALAARTQYTVDAALEPITAVVKSRDRETSRRWQAHYDLIRGRLLALKVRCFEYNWICARMKKDAPKFTKPDSNAWRLVPDAEIHSGDKVAAAGQQAVDLLKKVVAEHPNTPWSLLAQRELKDSLGFKWVEARVPPIIRSNNDAAAAAKKKAMNQPKPPDPPKL